MERGAEVEQQLEPVRRARVEQRDSPSEQVRSGIRVRAHERAPTCTRQLLRGTARDDALRRS